MKRQIIKKQKKSQEIKPMTLEDIFGKPAVKGFWEGSAKKDRTLNKIQKESRRKNRK